MAPIAARRRRRIIFVFAAVRSMRRSFPCFDSSGLGLALAALTLAGCATTAANAPTAAAAAPAAAASAPVAQPGPQTGIAPRPANGASAPGITPPAPTPPGQPQPFATVVREAKKTDGLFVVWQKDDKFWFELKPEDFGKPLFLSPKIARGIGEAGLFGGMMSSRFSTYGRPQIVEFRRIHNQVQLIARNSEFVATGNAPAARAVASGFSVSLIASTPVASLPHPERKTVLVEANNLFLGDMLGLSMTLNRAYRQSYSLDRANSAITAVRNKPELLVVETQNHFATGSLSMPQPGAAPGLPAPQVPQALPDPRSMFFGLHYSLAKLPDEPMKGRKADARVGYFTTTVQDFSDDLQRTPRVRYVNRWRLEKKEPAAAISEPVKPITFWLDRTIPVKYREAISKGILEWNKAYEKIGFKDAVVVKVQPDDADFDTLDLGIASVRWMTNAQPSFGAIGPSHVDPRSGEILDADIGFESLSSRGVRALRAQILSAKVSIDWPALMQSGPRDDDHGQPGHVHDPMLCTYADSAAEQLSYALDVLDARGDLDPASPEAQQFVLDYLTDTTMHEVGHTLGLRHNFRSSKIYTDKQLSDPDFTRSHGLAGSVMEYAPINLSRPGEKGGTPFQTALGPYDYWAIEYAYKPIPAEQEDAELKRIAARNNEPELAYGTDEDNFLGIDPESLHFDLGDDPVQFAKKRIEIARDLVKRQETRTLKPTEDYSVLRRGVTFALRDVGRATGILARQIGGLRTLRDFPGSGRDPLQPVPAAVQRDALDTLAKTVLAADTFLASPALQRRLAPDFNERSDALFSGDGPVATDFTLNTMLLDMQRALLSQLMSDAVAVRILDNAPKAASRREAFQLSELYGRLTREVWSELGGRGDIPSLRRELQREHLNRLAALLLRPGAASRADARSLLRVQAQGLLSRIAAASQRAGLSEVARAHLADSADTLNQALSAKLQRAGT
jgi:hypothetical protein